MDNNPFVILLVVLIVFILVGGAFGSILYCSTQGLPWSSENKYRREKIKLDHLVKQKRLEKAKTYIELGFDYDTAILYANTDLNNEAAQNLKEINNLLK